MFTHVGSVPTVNFRMCWPCSNCKCLQVLVLFLPQMSSCVGPVPTANGYMCWPCSNCKCLHMLVRSLLQMSTHAVPVPAANVNTFGPVPTANVLIFYLKQLNFNKILLNTVLQLPPAHDAQ